MAIAQTIFLFALGASVASFLAAMISRKNIRTQFSSEKRSHCDSCGRTLLWHELIPIFGFVLNRGQCKKCQNRIPTWYLLAEVLGGVVALGSAWLFTP